MLLIAAILAVYYPALTSGFHPVDDTGIVTFYSASPLLSNLLLPGNGYYYRPVVELSFYLDNLLWGMEPSVMHLENVLLHCANSLLVLLLARRIAGDAGHVALLIPVLSALVFAVHPVNVEAVVWVAGRTDLLLTLFVLSATCYWLRWFDRADWRDSAVAVLFTCLALLTKETAFAYGLVLLLLVLTRPGFATIRQRLLALSCVALPALLLLTFALVFRSGTSGLGRFLSGMESSLFAGLWKMLAATGFYASKLVIPWPLNFAIVEVNPWYGILALALAPLFFWLYRFNRSAAIMIMAAVLMIGPALLLTVKQIAWTPVAERYLYLSSAFFCTGVSALVLSFESRIRAIVVTGLVVMISCFSISSFQRTALWKDKLAFFQDAVAKSPEFGSLYNELGALFLKCGELGRAGEAFAAADRLNKRDSMRLPIQANLMGLQYVQGNHEAVRTMFFMLFKAKSEAPPDFLELLYKADSKRMHQLNGREKVLLAQDILETLGQLNRKRYDPFWLYRSGQLALVTGNTEEAIDFFRRSYVDAPTDAHYRGAAKTYLNKLERDKK